MIDGMKYCGLGHRFKWKSIAIEKKKNKEEGRMAEREKEDINVSINLKMVWTEKLVVLYM